MIATEQRAKASPKKSSSMVRLLCDLYPLHRTLNSDDFEKALKLIGSFLGEGFQIRSYEPGTPAYTWFVPLRYHVDEAYIEHKGKKYANFADNNLSLVSYSIAVDKEISYEELRKHVHTSPALPEEIPWVFRYYEKTWGFCMSHNQWKSLDPKGKYRVVIKSRFDKKPFLVGEYLLRGKSKEEILWVSDICHPNQVNDSISGAVVAADIARQLKIKYSGRYSIRFLFLAEIIGSIVWFSRNEAKIKNMKHGFFTEMVGNQNRFLLKQSRMGNALIDRVMPYVLSRHERCGKAEIIPFKNIVPGNDEKVMDSIGIEIPSISLTRWPYREYHTTADNPSIIDSDNLDEAKNVFLETIRILNTSLYPMYQSKGPIFLSRFGLWVEYQENPELNGAIQRILYLMDGKHSVFDIAQEVGLDYDTVYSYLLKCEENKLIRWSAKPRCGKQ